jgi:uncharacterized membrane protein
VVVTCHCLEVLALAVWVGGLVSIVAAVIPAVFNTIGMEAGGRMLSKTFQGYDRLVMAAAAISVLAMAVRSRMTGDHVATSEAILLGVMVAVAAVLVLYLNPTTVRLQELAFTAKDELAKKAAYDEFFTYHRPARALYIINMGLGIALLCVKVRKWVR